MVPWLWFLTRTADCRIFQNRRFRTSSRRSSAIWASGFQVPSVRKFRARDYCVQYRETDFNFVSRLMEEEGIYYYFEHQDGKHMLILANDPAAHEPCPNQKTARYDFRGGSVTYEDVVTEWHHEEEFRPGAWAQTDYNFETPSTSLAASVNGKNPYEIYEYPGRISCASRGRQAGADSPAGADGAGDGEPRRGRLPAFRAGYTVHAEGSLPEQPEPGVLADVGLSHGVAGRRLPGRSGARRGADLSQQLRVHPVLDAVPSAARHAASHSCRVARPR